MSRCSGLRFRPGVFSAECVEVSRLRWWRALGHPDRDSASRKNRDDDAHSQLSEPQPKRSPDTDGNEQTVMPHLLEHAHIIPQRVIGGGGRFGRQDSDAAAGRSSSGPTAYPGPLFGGRSTGVRTTLSPIQFRVWVGLRCGADHGPAQLLQCPGRRKSGPGHLSLASGRQSMPSGR